MRVVTYARRGWHRERSLIPALALAAVAMAILVAACGGADRADRAALRSCVVSWNSRAENFNGQVLAGGYGRRYRVRDALVFRFAGGECGVAFRLPRAEAIQAVWARPADRQWNYWGALTRRLSLGDLDRLREDAEADANATMLLDGRLAVRRDAGIRRVTARLPVAPPA